MNRIRHYRQKAGLSLMALASKAEMNISTLHRMEVREDDDNGSLHLDTAQRVAGALGLRRLEALFPNPYFDGGGEA